MEPPESLRWFRTLVLVAALITAADACERSLTGARRLTAADNAVERDVAAKAFCEEYHLTERKTPVRILDVFMFNDELDMLEIRLTTLYDVVDFFVIVESRVTHQGRPKALHYADNKRRYAKFEAKIAHVVLNELKGEFSYFKEWYHREMLFEKGLSVRGREARPGDLIISGDLDEIPRPAAVQALRGCEWALQPGYHDCAVLEGAFFYYSFSWYAGEWSPGPKVFRHDVKETMEGMDKNDMRYNSKCTLFMKRASWHCTDCFSSIRAVKNKISAFCHAEKDRYPYNETEWIVDRVNRGLALFEPKEDKARLRRVPYCEYAPPAVLANPAKYHYMLARDPVTGSFSDYAEWLGNRTDVVGNFHAQWFDPVTEQIESV
ncbi:probable beta-1,4-mannosyl-glycoprotein 4-beta-N-acetylglucosaminyltransferase [Coccomyxa sp. Obi]|nr:probable beta-1,4-mannosyl-glycoprotein 4-beta-N-acetylglucosaminyltransferase [Coccomyxa sp. Obi]